jgi:hypothetical protein
MVFRSPKYYEELRKYRREKERRLQAIKLTSSQASGSQAPKLGPRAQAEVPSEPGSGSQIQGTSVPSPCPGNKQQE